MRSDYSIQTQNIHSLSDFQRNTSKHIRNMQDSGLPEVLTIKGKAELVVQTAESFQAMLNKIELYESALGIKRGIEDFREGRTSSVADYRARIKGKGLSSRVAEE